MEEALSNRVMGGFYRVRNMYGSGHREKFYDQILDEIMRVEGLSIVDKPRVPLYSMLSGKIVSYVVPDKLVEDKILIEIKAKPITLFEDIAQATEYLRIVHYEILYLVNFGERNFRPMRRIYTNDRKPFLSARLSK